MSATPFDLSAIGAGLPFASAVEELRAAVETPGAAVVVQAPPGTGKTTVAPAVVAGAVRGRVLVTQPRRVAVRAAARRLASLDGFRLGERVGYSVRGERVVSGDTRVEMLTPGLLLRRMMAAPDLDGVDAVVLDEVHERQLDTDVLLALLLDLRQLRDDLTLVVMSATLDAARYEALLSGPTTAPRVVGVDAPTFPLQVRWAPPSGPRLGGRGVERAFLDHVVATTAAAHQSRDSGRRGDALVFLPGVREVDHVVSGLSARLPEVAVLPLHGRVDAEQQDRAVGGGRDGDPTRIVVATGVAESSLTVPGVDLVVDAGLTREPRLDRARGMSGLVTVTASKASMAQRAGRANRQAAGVVVRCYSPDVHAGAPDHLTPELAVADLTDSMLMLAAWGTPGGRGLRWLDEPPAASVAAAVEVLRALGAVDEAGVITAAGRRMAALPLDPRWGRALLASSDEFGVGVTAEVVAAASADLRPVGADLVGLLRSLRAGRHPQTPTWRRDCARLTAAYGATVDQSRDRHPDAVAATVMRAWPDRVARRVDDTIYLLARGTRAALPLGSPLIGEAWLAVADVARAEGRQTAGTGAVIRAAAPLDAARAESGDVVDEVTAEVADGRVRARRVRRLGAIELEATPVALDAEQGTAAVAAALRRQGLGMLHFSADAQALRRRLDLLHRRRGEPWPPVDDDSLLERWQEWLVPEMRELALGADIRRINLLDAVRRLLPWPEAARLDELAPERLPVPSGRAVRLRYPEIGADAAVVVEVKLQECFGLAQSPRILGEPVLFHLLSPAGRALAVTDDLSSFWSGPYRQVRAEMRGRYPKHPWPEDPWTAPATAKTSRRAGRG